jgi:hypothetical protein
VSLLLLLIAFSLPAVVLESPRLGMLAGAIAILTVAGFWCGSASTGTLVSIGGGLRLAFGVALSMPPP